VLPSLEINPGGVLRVSHAELSGCHLLTVPETSVCAHALLQPHKLGERTFAASTSRVTSGPAGALVSTASSTSAQVSTTEANACVCAGPCEMEQLPARFTATHLLCLVRHNVKGRPLRRRAILCALFPTPLALRLAETGVSES
jgi:hypothetical protein